MKMPYGNHIWHIQLGTNGREICATHTHHAKNFWISLFSLALYPSDAPKHRCQLAIRKEMEMGLTVAQRENRLPSASSLHPDLHTGWTQCKEAAALCPPTSWQLHVGIPMAAGKELAAVLPPRAPSLQETIYTSPSKNWLPRYFIQPNDNW